MRLNWIWTRPVLYFATTPTVPSGTTDGGSGAAGGGGGAPPAPAAPPSGAPAPGGQPPVSGIEQIRTQYENLKKEYEPWKGLGIDHNQAQTSHSIFTKLFSEAAATGRELGYPDDEIIEALKEDPVRTLDYLRNEAARRQQGQQGNQGDDRDLSEQIQERIEQAIGPIQQRENIRATNEANSLFERTVHGLITDSFKAEGMDISKVSQDEVELLTNATSEILKYDDKALHGLKYEGKTAPIQKAFAEARTMIDKYYIARSARERSRVGGGPPPPPGAPPVAQGKRPSLDDMINDPNSIRRAQGKSDYGS